MPPAEYDSEATRLTAVLHRTRTHGVTAGPGPAGPGAGPASVRTAAAAALRPPWLSGPAAVTTQPGQPDLSLPSAGAGQADGVCGVTIEGPDLPGSQAHPASYLTQCDARPSGHVVRGCGVLRASGWAVPGAEVRTRISGILPRRRGRRCSPPTAPGPWHQDLLCGPLRCSRTVVGVAHQGATLHGRILCSSRSERRAMGGAGAIKGR